jgi:hypothetical protein
MPLTDTQTEVRKYRGPIVRKYGPDGTLESSSVVKNLGWLYRHAGNVERMRLIWAHTLPNGSYSSELVCVLIADGKLPNGNAFKYGSIFNSVEVARAYMGRRRFVHAVREDRTVPVLATGPYADPQLNDSRTIGQKRKQHTQR